MKILREILKKIAILSLPKCKPWFISDGILLGVDERCDGACPVIKITLRRKNNLFGILRIAVACRWIKW
ncbi:MAG: hypothetical protein LBC11_02130 [Puniceicoccales bacterium]|jgi:hypothetical protein|nr:hypothetical protein [Puniceicoccales bacterium]